MLQSKPKVLFIGDLNESLPEYKQFQTKFECIKYEITTEEQLINDFKTKFTDIQAIYGAWLGFVLIGGFKNNILQNSPPNLKVISVCSVGYDPYDTEAMRKRGIILTNVPSIGAAEPVADLVLYNTLASFRNFKIVSKNFNKNMNHTVKQRIILGKGQFVSDTGLVKPNLVDEGYEFGHTVVGRENLSPRNHHVVIIGFGNIGQTIGKKLSDIGMIVHYVKRNQLSSEQESILPYKVIYHKSLDEITQFVDLIVVACPGTPETKHLINSQVIDSIDKPFRIINIGRGSVIDEQALVNGLKQGKVVFAGLDVFEDEPKVHPDLFDRDDVSLTPHIGASTVENFDFTAVTALQNIENVLLDGGEGIHTVN